MTGSLCCTAESDTTLQINYTFFFFFLRHMEVHKLGLESELQLPAYTTATATPEMSCICDLHHSSWQCQILKPLSEAKNQTRVLMDASWVCSH